MEKGNSKHGWLRHVGGAVAAVATSAAMAATGIDGWLSWFVIFVGAIGGTILVGALIDRHARSLPCRDAAHEAQRS